MIAMRDVAVRILELADKNPDFVYQVHGADGECNYTIRDDNDQLVGDCIVGQALISLGVRPTKLYELEGMGAHAVLQEFTTVSSEDDTNLLWKIDSVQGNQDIGRSWGLAVKELRDYLGENNG
jgi:hypothetical protein